MWFSFVLWWLFGGVLSALVCSLLVFLLVGLWCDVVCGCLVVYGCLRWFVDLVLCLLSPYFAFWVAWCVRWYLPIAWLLLVCFRVVGLYVLLLAVYWLIVL